MDSRETLNTDELSLPSNSGSVTPIQLTVRELPEIPTDTSGSHDIEQEKAVLVAQVALLTNRISQLEQDNAQSTRQVAIMKSITRVSDFNTAKVLADWQTKCDFIQAQLDTCQLAASKAKEESEIEKKNAVETMDMCKQGDIRELLVRVHAAESQLSTERTRRNTAEQVAIMSHEDILKKRTNGQEIIDAVRMIAGLRARVTCLEEALEAAKDSQLQAKEHNVKWKQSVVSFLQGKLVDVENAVRDRAARRQTAQAEEFKTALGHPLSGQ